MSVKPGSQRFDVTEPMGRRKLYIHRDSLMTDERSSYLDHWKDLARFVTPRLGRYLSSDAQEGGQRNRNRGSKKNGSIINNAATMAHRVMSAGMMSGATSPARPWFRLVTPDPDLNEYAPVKDWLNSVERNMREVFSKSNTYNALQQNYQEQGLFGTWLGFVLPDFDDVVRIYPATAGEYKLGLSPRNEVDTAYREFQLTVHQLVSRFGLDNVSKRAADMYERGDYDNFIDVIHVVQPNPNYDPRAERRLTQSRHKFVSTYMEKNISEETDGAFLRERGFARFVGLAPRWDVLGSDVYGRSPAMEALGDVKQLQHQEKRKGQAIDKLVDPPLVGPGTMRNTPVSTLPGSVSYVDGSDLRGAGLSPVYQVEPKLGELREDMNSVSSRIDEAFYKDLFLAIIEADRRDMTATEVAQRQEEKLVMLGPVLERLQNELLDPLVDLTFDYMMEAGLVPPAPQELEGSPLRVEYISILAQAQRAVGITSIDRLTGYVISAAQVNQSVIDKFDFDQAVDEYSNMLGTPAKLVLPDDVVERRRAARAEIQAQEAQQAQAQQLAQAEKDLATAAATRPAQELLPV